MNINANGAEQCCGQHPTLRVRPRLVLPDVIVPYVRFECRKCQAQGGLALNLAEAISLWPWPGVAAIWLNTPADSMGKS